MGTVEDILPFERDFFLWLNHFHADYWDRFMFLYSGKAIWLPLVITTLFVFAYKVKWKEAIILIFCAVLVGTLCDQISSSIIKPLFERMRPTHHPDFEHVVRVVNGYRGGRLGFVSSHAANGFGIVTFSALLFRYRPYTIVITLWALVTCYSRIYLGVHFISDIVGGIVTGIVIGVSVYYIYLAARYYILKIPKDELQTPVLGKLRAKILIGTILSLVLSIAIYSSITDIPS